MLNLLPTFKQDALICPPKEVQMADRKFSRDDSAIDRSREVTGNSSCASRLRRQSLRTTAHLAAPAGLPTANIGKTGEYVGPSAKVAAELNIKVSSDASEASTNANEATPLNGGKQGWNHARGNSYGSLNTTLEEAATTPLRGATLCSSSHTNPSIFDAEHSISHQHAKVAVYSWNKWMKLYIGFLIAIFLTFGVLVAMWKVGDGRREQTVEVGNGSAKSSAGTSTETPSFWYTREISNCKLYQID